MYTSDGGFLFNNLSLLGTSFPSLAGLSKFNLFFSDFNDCCGKVGSYSNSNCSVFIISTITGPVGTSTKSE